ncbi:MAG: hypothetical protein HOI47_17560, partial [Candidatus Scalindua sp.]|nr:hypothetical protein [Candidatus Scalindua sp.]
MADEIILIRPKNIYNYNNYPPLNLINLASVLKLNKYNVSIINAHLEEDVLAVINKKLEDCLFIGITLLTGDVPDAYRIMKF